MKAIGKVAIIGGIGLALSQIFKVGTTANTAQKLTIAPSNFRWNGIKNSAVNFDLGFNVINPTRQNLTINFLFADISLINGTKITSLTKQNWNFTLGKEAQTSLTVPVKIFLVDLLLIGKEIVTMFKERKIPKQLKAKGYIKVNNYTVPFDEIIDLA